jgi:putative transposase
MRKPRSVVPELPHHVFTRGNNRRRLFSARNDYLRFLHYIEGALDDEQCRLHALALMTNHVHLLLTPASPPALGRFMKSVNQRFASFRNGTRAGSGKLYEERFQSKPVTDDAQLAVTTAYIEANPIRAGLVRRPDEYPWTTYGLHAGTPCAVAPQSWTPSPWYLGLGADPASRQAHYREFFGDYIQEPLLPDGIEVIAAREVAAALPYTRRLERPDRSRATEPPATYELPEFARRLRGTPKKR